MMGEYQLQFASLFFLRMVLFVAKKKEKEKRMTIIIRRF
jgi:hypothetical protein